MRQPLHKLPIYFYFLSLCVFFGFLSLVLFWQFRYHNLFVDLIQSLMKYFIKNVAVPELARALPCHRACWHGTARFLLDSAVPGPSLRHVGTIRHGTTCRRAYRARA